MADTELWVVSHQTGALGTMTSPPCCPSTSEWWGWTAVSRSWVLQTLIGNGKVRRRHERNAGGVHQTQGSRQACPRLLPPPLSMSRTYPNGPPGQEYGGSANCDVILTTEPDCQVHFRVENIAKREVGDTDRYGTSFMGGKPR